MAAIGCLLPFVLLVAGGAVGGVIGGTRDSILGAAIGAVVGLAAMMVMLRWFERARGDLPE